MHREAEQGNEGAKGAEEEEQEYEVMRVLNKKVKTDRGTGTDRIELYTEAYARGYAADRRAAVAPYREVAALAAQLGLGVNAGHDLDLDNLAWLRQQLPALAISGATYSENPQYRMVIVNGQVLHEGDTAAPGVVLEKIRQKEVVLRTQGQRYRMGY